MWRRSYDVPPPELDKSSEHYPGNDEKYALLDAACLPTTESLYTTSLRVIPYWQSVIVPEIKVETNSFVDTTMMTTSRRQ